MEQDRTLEQIALERVCHDFAHYRPVLGLLPATTVCDILYQVSKAPENVTVVKIELTSRPLFLRLLNARNKWQKLLRVFQIVHDQDIQSRPLSLLSESLAASYVESWGEPGDRVRKQGLSFKDGLLLGDFLLLSGWFNASANVLQYCYSSYCVGDKEDTVVPCSKSLLCLEKLLLAQSFYSLVKESAETYQTAMRIVESIKSEESCDVNLSKMYNAFSIYHYSENRYDQALRWSIKALQLIVNQDTSNNPIDYTLVVDVLRQASTCCSVKREIGKAKLLITKAVCIARDVFGNRSVKYSDVLMDYGYYLISSDNVQQGLEVYTIAVQIREDAFGVYNLVTAMSMSELSYSLYVHEYNSGKFDQARSYSDLAIEVMEKLLPKDHLVLASARRVLALILEEIAIDNTGTQTEQDLLKEAEKLHISCLEVTTKVFGEMNVQTAKHYGNLGRLYQTMKKFQEAETMHLKAILIKEAMLGDMDYEVALSVGHLASLYNYDLYEYHKAEQLHLRSIHIGRKLFGEAYSGLEYDYRGLLQVYLMSEQLDKYAEYSGILANWKQLQDLKSAALQGEQVIGKQLQCNESLSTVVKDFFDMRWLRWKDSCISTDEEQR